MMGSRIEHIEARDINSDWIGSTVTLLIASETVAGVLTDYKHPNDFAPTTLFVSGQVLQVPPSTTVTRGDLDLLGAT